MADLSLELEGLEETIEDLDRLQERWTGGGSWVVGTAVNYSVFLEFGTSKMDPKPFVRPALHEARRSVEGFIRDNTNTTVSEIDSARELVRVIAFALERRIKEIITEKGLVDTGTMRASVLAVPGDDLSALPSPNDLETDEEGNPIDARVTASQSFEVNA